MTKESLISAGLTEEQAGSIMSELESNYIPKAQHDQLAAQLTAAKADAAQLTKAHEKELTALRVGFAVDQALANANAINPATVKPLLAKFLESAKLADDGTVEGLDGEIAKLTGGEGTAFLFRAAQTPAQAAPTISGASPASVPTATPDAKRSGYEARLAEARKSGNLFDCVTTKLEAAKDGIVLV